MPHLGRVPPELSPQETAHRAGAELARIADYARPREVLVSQTVVDQAEGIPAAFTEIGPVELRGVPEATRRHVARREPAAG